MIDFSDSFKSKLEKYDFDMVVSRTYIKSQDIGQYIRDLGKDYMRALKDSVSKYYPDYIPTWLVLWLHINYILQICLL